MTVETSRSVGEQLALELDRVDERARASSPPARRSADSGCGRRVSEKRRTSASVLASRNSERIGTPSPRSSSISGSRCGSEPALRTSTATATRRVEALVLQAQEVAQQLGRQVVDAEEAGVLQRVQRHRLARARDAGDQHHLAAVGGVPAASPSRVRGAALAAGRGCALIAASARCAPARRCSAPTAEHGSAHARRLVPDSRSPPSMRAISADARLAGHRLHVADASAALQRLGDDEVMVGAGRHLRQVRDGQHLAVAAELLHQPADRVGHRAADAGVDLVEDQRRRAGLRRVALAVVTAIASARRDSSPPEATLASGRGVLPAWPATQELGRLQAEGLRLVLRHQRHLEAAAGHAELLHRLRHRGRQLGRRGAARLRDALRLACARPPARCAGARFAARPGRWRRRARCSSSLPAASSAGSSAGGRR